MVSRSDELRRATWSLWLCVFTGKQVMALSYKVRSASQVYMCLSCDTLGVVATMVVTFSSISSHVREYDSTRAQHKYIFMGFLCIVLVGRIINAVISWIRDVLGICILLLAVFMILVRKSPRRVSISSSKI